MIVAEVVRSGFVESVHHGIVAFTSGDGVGDVESPFFPVPRRNRCRRSGCSTAVSCRATRLTWP